jgi:signal transduction histidine kinase
MSLLAHDLRNPLSAAITNVNFVRSSMRGRAPDVEEALSDSALSCTILGQVIGNLDILSRAFSSSPLAKNPTAARRAADEAVVRFAPQAAMSSVRLEALSGPDAPVVFVEPTFFARALDNLVANALQYSPVKGEVLIECTATADRGILVVLDDGPAIPADLRHLATLPEWQGQAKLHYEARYGRGLGLFCASEAARIAGAELSIGDRTGRSTFELSAPLAPR